VLVEVNCSVVLLQDVEFEADVEIKACLEASVLDQIDFFDFLSQEPAETIFVPSIVSIAGYVVDDLRLV
jgi:hypothetical protein